MQFAQPQLSTVQPRLASMQSAEPCLAYRIGGITFGIFGENGLKLCLTSAIRIFEVATDSCDVRIQIGCADRLEAPKQEPAFDSGGLWSVYERDGGLQFFLTSPYLGTNPYKTAYFDHEFAAGWVRLSHEYFRDRAPMYPLEYPLDELLMIYRLARGEGVEVHAVGLRDEEGRGHLFIGHSGAGKSTTAHLWSSIPGVRILSDDRIILRADRCSEQRGIRMYGTPWHGDAGIASPESAPLYRTYVLEHGAKNELAMLPPARATAEYFARSFVPFHSPAAAQFALSFFDRAAHQVPSFSFRFLPDQSAVEAIRNALA